MKLTLLAAALATASWLNATPIQGCSSGTTTCFAGSTETISGNYLDLLLTSRLSSTVPATANFSLSRAYVTAGSPRPGLMGLTLTSSGDYGSSGSSSGSVTFAGYSCSNSSQNGGLCYFASLRPVLLGQPLSVDMQISLSRGPSNPDALDGGERELQVTALFFENNGGVPGAPVNVSAAPEPATLALILPFLAMAALRRALQRRS